MSRIDELEHDSGSEFMPVQAHAEPEPAEQSDSQLKRADLKDELNRRRPKPKSADAAAGQEQEWIHPDNPAIWQGDRDDDND